MTDLDQPCILCARQLDVTNASEICRECRLLVHNLLDVRIEELWAAAVGLDEHIVSEWGRVARLLKVDHSHRYPRVSVGGEKVYVHHLVAGAFHGPRPEGLLGHCQLV